MNGIPFDRMRAEADVRQEKTQADLEPKFTDALVRELIQEEEEAIRGLDYLVTRHRTRLAWLRAVQRGTIKP